MAFKPPYIVTTVLCSILLTLQLVFLAGTIFLFFSSQNISIQRIIITALYRRDTWRDMRRSDALTYHALVALIVQVVFLPLTVTALIGVAKRKCWMLVPWLVVSGLAVLGGLLGSILCVLVIPTSMKLIAIPVSAITIFLLFPTWFTSLHVFAHLCSKNSYNFHSRRQDYLFKYLYA